MRSWRCLMKTILASYWAIYCQVTVARTPSLSAAAADPELHVLARQNQRRRSGNRIYWTKEKNIRWRHGWRASTRCAYYSRLLQQADVGGTVRDLYVFPPHPWWLMALTNLLFSLNITFTMALLIAGRFWAISWWLYMPLSGSRCVVSLSLHPMQCSCHLSLANLLHLSSHCSPSHITQS